MTEETEYLDLFKSVMPEKKASLTPARMIELGMIHELAEFNNDLDGILATLVDVPVYELHPLGVRITGRDAVRVFYERTLYIFRQFDQRKPVQTRKVISVGYGDCHIAVEVEDDFKFPDGSVKRIQFLASVEFREEAMYGERLYADYEFAKVVEDALGEEFFKRPDVTKIGS